MSVASWCVFVLFCECVFLYGQIYHSALKLGMYTLFTTFFLWTSLQFIFRLSLHWSSCFQIDVREKLNAMCCAGNLCLNVLFSKLSFYIQFKTGVFTEHNIINNGQQTNHQLSVIIHCNSTWSNLCNHTSFREMYYTCNVFYNKCNKIFL